jgi:dihydrodipicolinate synthase/N-acetylneuraminate lyase
MSASTIGGTKRFHGVVVPMVTPVTHEGALDELAVCRVVEHMIAGGVDGIFVLGTTGEAASVSYADRARLVALTVQHVAGRAVTYAGIGDNCLAHSAQAAEEYFRLGADAVVAHLPTYYPLSAEDQYDYYETLATQVPGPLMLYNIPTTTHMSIPVEVLERLSHHPRVVGLKDSENSEARLEAVVAAMGGRSDLSIFVGVTALAARGLGLGADGTVPSSGNLVPDICHILYERGRAGDKAGAKVMQRQLDDLAGIYQRGRPLGGTLAALKAAMGAQGLCGPDVLPPLRPLAAAEQETIRHSFLEWQRQNAVSRV